MLEIKCTVPRFELVEDGANSMMQSLMLSFDEKETNCSVKGIELYKSEGEAFSADVDIPYEYDSKKGMLRISAPDYEGERIFKTAFKKNGKQVEVEALDTKDVLKKWSSAYTKALYEQIVEHARENKMTILTRNNWDKQLSENIWVHYKDGAFYRLSTKEHNEEVGIKSVPLKSVEGGALSISIRNGTHTRFWNVIGSTCDCFPGKPSLYKLYPNRSGWLGLLDQYVYNYFCIAPQKQCICKAEGGQCPRTDLVGGHIVFDKGNVYPRTDPQHFPDHVVGLLPICKGHNHRTNEDAMQPAVDAYGIWLDRYSGALK